MSQQKRLQRIERIKALVEQNKYHVPAAVIVDTDARNALRDRARRHGRMAKTFLDCTSVERELFSDSWTALNRQIGANLRRAAAWTNDRARKDRDTLHRVRAAWEDAPAETQVHPCDRDPHYGDLYTNENWREDIAKFMNREPEPPTPPLWTSPNVTRLIGGGFLTLLLWIILR